RVGIAIAQLGDVRKLRLLVTQLSLHAHSKIKPFGWRIVGEHDALHPAARLLVASATKSEQREPIVRHRIARLRAKRAAEILLGKRGIAKALSAASRVDQCDFGCL